VKEKQLPPDGFDEPQEEPLSGKNFSLLAGGLFAYILGFALLAHDCPNAGPLIIVGGIVTMFWAFLL
jgi:hypothetical protein